MKPFYPIWALLIVIASISQGFSQGNVGIGTTSPVYTLDVHSPGNAQFNLTEGVGGQTALFSRYTNRMEIQPTDAFELSIGGVDQRNLFVNSTGTGIKNASPANMLEIGVAPGFSGNHLAMGNGTQAMSFFQSATSSIWYTNTLFSLMPYNGGSGYLGINTMTPVNSLQIGSVGTTGYSGNAIAFGSPNGTQASGLAQTTAVAEWNSTTTIALMPNGNGHGRVGINTTTPGYPLEVDDYVGNGYITYAYYSIDNSGKSPQANIGGTIVQPGTTNVSIAAQANVVAAEFDAVSDIRIKDIEGITDNEKDLATLDAIEVTDYTMKDKAKTGNKQYKKVIAQQVERVYPQVINKGVNFIPNVYQLTGKIEKTSGGYLLSFKNSHHIDSGAKKLQLITKDGKKQVHDIVSIPSDRQVLIHSEIIPDDQVFVYGEQVNDFRSVDYDGLTTLNMSATQELSKLIKQQQEEIEELIKKVAELEKEVNKSVSKN